MIEAGTCTEVIVAGADLLTEFVIAGFRSFKSVSETVCRPYDKARDGLSLGEGCGALLLTTDSRKAKGTPVLLAGGAMTQDANHLSAPSRTGEELAAAMREGDAGGGLTPGKSASSTPTARRPFTTTKWRAGPCIGPGWGTSP